MPSRAPGKVSSPDRPRRIAWFEPLEPSPHHRDYEAGTSLVEILAEEREQADREERGDVLVFEPPHDTTSTQWQRYMAESRAWRRAIDEGSDPGPKPEPPARRSVRESPEFREQLKRRAARRRGVLPFLRVRPGATRSPGSSARRPSARPIVRSRARTTNTRRSASRAGPSDDSGPSSGDGESEKPAARLRRRLEQLGVLRPRDPWAVGWSVWDRRAGGLRPARYQLARAARWLRLEGMRLVARLGGLP